MRLFPSDRYPLPLPEGHRFPVAKYAALRRRLEGHAAAGAPLAFVEQKLASRLLPFCLLFEEMQLPRAMLVNASQFLDKSVSTLPMVTLNKSSSMTVPLLLKPVMPRPSGSPRSSSSWT